MFKLNSESKFEIETSTGVYSEIAAGITSVDVNLNDQLDQTTYLDSGSFGTTDVVAAQVTLSFSGHRDYGDAAQDYIYGKILTLGTGRRSKFKFTDGDGAVLSGNCTICNISGPGGDAGAKGAISFEIHLNGQPTLA